MSYEFGVMGWVWFVNRAWLLSIFTVKKNPFKRAFFSLSLKALNNRTINLNPSAIINAGISYHTAVHFNRFIIMHSKFFCISTKLPAQY